MKFRRKAAEKTAEESQPEPREALDPLSGPFDESQVEGDDVPRVDLGSVLIPAIAGRELRLQVDEESGVVRTVILAGPDGALEFQAFAAPRHGELWETVRSQISEDLVKRGGHTEEREGRWGTELVCQVPVKRPDGTAVAQPSRIIGVNGERWMLRASLLGRPAMEDQAAREWEDTLAQIVVRRGAQAMPVGEALPIAMPDDARRVD